eukprot:6199196-Pleurochrysis_carterae.AAC.1
MPLSVHCFPCSGPPPSSPCPLPPCLTRDFFGWLRVACAQAPLHKLRAAAEESLGARLDAAAAALVGDGVGDDVDEI